MNEASKTKKIWGALEKSAVHGTGIDIGCGRDPIFPDVRKFDVEDGDANRITEHVHEQFDFVFSSHCLEHMNKPQDAIHEWWKLVKPGGHLIVIVPDEDLYEQGIYPSRFNPDHKATFTMSKAVSWSPVSINLLDMARSLPNSQLVQLVLQDYNYDRRRLRHGRDSLLGIICKFSARIYGGLRRRGLFGIPFFERIQLMHGVIDQTLRDDVLAQIQCILRKAG